MADPPNSYPPDVERWRSLVARYFPAAQVGKAMWVIHFESEGDPSRMGDYDPVRKVWAAVGLFQIQSSVNFPDRPAAQQLADAEFNIRYAAGMVGPDGKGWTNWGDYGNTYQGKPFGALGNHPYPGDPPPAVLPPTVDPQLFARIERLEARADAVDLALYAGREQIGTRPLLLDRLEYAQQRRDTVALGLAPSIVELVGASLTEKSGLTRDDLVALLEGVLAVVKGGKP